MADGRFNPITLHYVGLDADRHEIELLQLGISIQGAARLLGASGQVALTGSIAQKDGVRVRVLAGVPKEGSYDIPVILVGVGALVAPMLPEVSRLASLAATKAVEAITNHAIAKMLGKKKEERVSNDIATKALEELGMTARAAITMVEKVAAQGQPAVRQFLAPVGPSAYGAMIGEPQNGAFLMTPEDRLAIDDHSEPQPEVTISPQTELLLRLTELDLVTGNCKVSLQGAPDDKDRIPGIVTDPQVKLPRNVYSGAFDAQAIIRVRAKCQLLDGEIEKVFISDAVA